MSTFPADAAAFYALRDDRTNRCTASPAYQRVAVAVTLEQNLRATRTGRVVFQVVGNLLARWCRHVTVITPMPDPIVEETLAVMRDADPLGTFTTAASLAHADVHVHLGRGCQQFTEDTVVVDAAGWLSWLGSTDGPSLPRDEHNVLGAVAAACLGVAQVFKIAIGAPAASRLRAGMFDLFGLSWTDTITKRVLSSGARCPGAVAACGRRIGRVSGRLSPRPRRRDRRADGLDGDVVGIENFNRSLLFGRQTFGLPKVAAVGRALAGSTVLVTPFNGWWDAFVAAPDHGSFDVWLPLANERGVRWSMQQNLPPLLIHASTGVNGGVNFGRHIPGRGDCLVERFPAELEGAPLVCATSAVPTPEGRVDAAHPFASVFAGLLVVADLVRLQVLGYPHVPNLAVLDFGGDLARPLLVDRQSRLGCTCRGQRELALRVRRDTRYAALFAQ